MLSSLQTTYNDIPKKERKKKTEFIAFIYDKLKSEGYQFLCYNKQQCGWYVAPCKHVHDRIRSTLGRPTTTTTQVLFRSITIKNSVVYKIITTPIALNHKDLIPNNVGKVYDGQLQSFAFPDFLQMDDEAGRAAKQFFNTLFCSRCRMPSEAGDGICLTVDKIYHRWTLLNIHRPSYLRQGYGLDDTSKQTNNPHTVFRFTYGTGSGALTAGTPPW